jgi:hypothetical protein
MRKRSWWTKALLAAGGFVVLSGFAALVLVSLYIGRDVKAAGEAARQRYAGDTVEALKRCVEDHSCTLRERNRAVWALGQLSDRRALPVLREHLTGQPCDHAHELCQHELEKAIALIDGGLNVTAWIRRETASK